MMKYGHDDNCGGCFTSQRFAEANGGAVAVTATLDYCGQCGYMGNSAYFHRVNHKTLCSTCADREVLATQKDNALEAFREACQ